MSTKRTYMEITKEEEPWASLSKILAFRFHLNRIENMLISIYAEHAVCRREDFEDPNYTKVYAEIWDEIGDFEKRIVRIKRRYKKAKPEDVTLEAGVREEERGCWKDEDCWGDWWCNPDTWTCMPPPREEGLGD